NLKLPLGMVHRPQEMGEDVVGHLGALLDAPDLVEAPVDAEVDAALAVLLGGLAEAVEGARHHRADVAGLVAGGAVGFVPSGGEEVGEKGEGGGAKGGMARGVSRKGRGEVGAAAVVVGRSQRCPVAYSRGARIAVRGARANGGDRPPEIVVVLGGPDSDARI